MTPTGSVSRCWSVLVEPLPKDAIRAVVAAALAEDRAFEDVTTLATVAADLQGTARFLAKQDGILAGMDVAFETFRHVDPAARLTVHIPEGGAFRKGTILAEVSGPSGPSSRASAWPSTSFSGSRLPRRSPPPFVDAVAGTRAVILDTRKTTPGLRDLEKYAVRCGGGRNHRRDLAVMAMIKDNHREALARESLSLADGVAAIRERTPGVPVEVEIDSLDQLEAALAAAPSGFCSTNGRGRHGGGGAQDGRPRKARSQWRRAPRHRPRDR